MLSHIFIFAIILMSADFKEAKFRVKLVAVTTLRKPSSQMALERPMTSTVVLRKVSRETTVCNFNATCTKKFGPVLFTYRAYQLQNAQKDLISKLERVSCTNPIFKIADRLHVNFDKDCNMLPGQYYYESMNIDKFAMIITKSMAQPGRYGYEIEFSSPKGIVACAFVICDLTLRKK